MSKIRIVVAFALVCLGSALWTVAGVAAGKGDVNNDSTVNVFDALLTLQYSVELYHPPDEAVFKTAADVAPLDSCNEPLGNGTVNVFDALAILRHAVNLDEWMCIPGPPAPDKLIASPGDSRIALNWPQAGRAVSYKIYRGTAPGVTKASPTYFTSTTNQYVDTSVSNGTKYYYIVTPVDQTGEGAASPEASVIPQLIPPPFAPTDVYTYYGPASIPVMWTLSADATSYNIYYGTAPGITKQSTKFNVPGPWNWSIVPGFTNGTKYYLAVTAVNANGESPVSLEVSATPSGIGPIMPPTLTATAGANKVDLSWSSSMGSLSVTYNIYMATCSPVIPGPSTLVASGITGTSTTITSLNSSTTYYFVATLVYSNVESSKSTEVNATP